MKKSISLLIALLFMVSFIVACAENPAEPESVANVPASSAVPEDTTEPARPTDGYDLPLVDEPTTLVFMRADTNRAGASYADGKALTINEAEKITGVTIQWEVTPQAEYTDVLNLRLASQQNLPDIIQLRGGQEKTYLLQHLSNGLIIPLNDYVEEFGAGYRRIFETYPITKELAMLPDGSIAGFHKLEVNNYAYAAQLIRQDWLDNLDLEMPTTLEELLEVAIAFTFDDPDGNGKDDTYGLHCANPSGNMFEYNQLAAAFGLGLCTGEGWSLRDGQVTFEWVLPEAKEYLLWFRQVVEAGVLPADYASVTYPEHDARVANGQVGLIPRSWPNNIIEWGNPNSSMAQNQPDAEWRVVPGLKSEVGASGDPRIIRETTLRGSNALSISTSCANPELAFKWLDWACYSEEGINLNMLGIEGVMYDYENGKPVRLENVYSNDTPIEDGTWWGREYVEQVSTADIVEAGFKVAGISTDDVAIKGIQANWPYLVEPYYPAAATVELGQELNSMLTEIQTYREEMWAKFCDGSLSIEDNWDEYLDRLNQLGLPDVLEIYQQTQDARN